MAQSLMAALHDARSMINEGVIHVELEHGNPWVALLVAHHQTRPEQVAELYNVAGMIGPSGAPSPVAQSEVRQQGYHQPHAKAVTQRVMAMLRGGPHTAQELSQGLGAKVGTVLTSINRLRERGAQIEGTSYGRSCRYTLKSD